TVSLLQGIDLVITVESALGHIAGAIGKECWIPYSWRGRDYRIGNTGAKVLWYPNHRVFQQGRDCRWEPVFKRIEGALYDKIADKRKDQSRDTKVRSHSHR